MYLNLHASIVKEIQISMCIYAVKAVWPCTYAAKPGHHTVPGQVAQVLNYPRLTSCN